MTDKLVLQKEDLDRCNRVWKLEGTERFENITGLFHVFLELAEDVIDRHFGRKVEQRLVLDDQIKVTDQNVSKLLWKS